MSWKERTEMLVGEDGLSRLSRSYVAVIGLGGVGAYAAEMVVRAGVGKVLIADSDSVSDSNRNRQLLALTSTVGVSKVELMEVRLKDINPDVEIVTCEEYLTEENIPSLFEGGVPDYVVDAIDTLAPKIALIRYCVSHKIKLVSSMGAGAKFDASKVRIADLSKSYNCPLAYMLRKRLRKEGISKGFNVVFSEELPEREAIVPVEGETNKKSQVGTISYLPAVFGCLCAQDVLTNLLRSSSFL